MLKDVSYGAVSAYMAVSPGQYTVAMRGGLNACAARTALRTGISNSPAVTVG